MGRSVFQDMGGQRPRQPSFVEFMNANEGQDPNALINQAVSRFGIDQNQLNWIQQKANEISKRLEQFKGMFGF